MLSGWFLVWTEILTQFAFLFYHSPTNQLLFLLFGGELFIFMLFFHFTIKINSPLTHKTHTNLALYFSHYSHPLMTMTAFRSMIKKGSFIDRKAFFYCRTFYTQLKSCCLFSWGWRTTKRETDDDDKKRKMTEENEICLILG